MAKESKSNKEQICQKQCPFGSSYGYSTKQTRKEYLDLSSNNALADDDDVQRSSKSSLTADMDINKPLYFWQLHSLIGREPILDICADFYNSVYMDYDAPWFRQVFEDVAPKQHHILVQAAYWIDAMGGGRLYHGGLTRLNYHHHYNASEIMNAKGAKRWMYHMKKSLRKNYIKHFQQQSSTTSDPRILPCIVDFLETKMKSYANNHGWEFDASDFRIEDFYPPTGATVLDKTTTIQQEQQRHRRRN